MLLNQHNRDDATQKKRRYSFFRVEGQIDSENKRHETEKSEEGWKYRRTKTTQCHYGFGKYEKQKQNSEKLHGIEYLLMAKRAVFIFKVTLLGLLEPEDGCSIQPRNVDFFPDNTAEHTSPTGSSSTHR